MAFTPMGDAFAVAFVGSNVVEVWDANTLKRLSEVNVGRAPVGLAFRQDGRRLYVHNFLDRSVSVLKTDGLLDGSANQPILVATVSTVGNEALAPEVLRGKRIFYNAADPRMSRDGYISCASCHLDGGSDGMVWDRTQFGEGFRNTIDLRGRRGANGGFVHWSANFDEIQDFEHDIRNAFGGTGFMSEAAFQEGQRDEPLGHPKAGASRELDALAAYLESLDETPDSPHRTGQGALTEHGLLGRQVFAELRCARCHSGSDFTDDGMHDVGTIRTTSGAQLEAVNTPTLKGLWLGAPYLHDGSAATLAEVLDNAVHMGSDLTEQQASYLATYLLQLDDKEPPPVLVPRAAPPAASIATVAGPGHGRQGGGVHGDARRGGSPGAERCSGRHRERLDAVGHTAGVSRIRCGRHKRDAERADRGGQRGGGGQHGHSDAKGRDRLQRRHRVPGDSDGGGRRHGGAHSLRGPRGDRRRGERDR